VIDDASSPATGEGGGGGEDARAKDAHGLEACDGGLACERVAFVTSARYSIAELGGLAGADARCAELASGSAAARTVKERRFLAWLSEGSVATWPLSRFVKGSGPYVRADGQPIADDWAGFASPSHLHAIDVDESGNSVSGATSVWTGTAADGTALTGTCAAWSASSGLGAVGSSAETSASWSHVTDLVCNLSARLYCVEQ
jgi:hypothetical protein